MSFKNRQPRFSNALVCTNSQAAANDVSANRNSHAKAAWYGLKVGALMVATVSLCAPPAHAGPGDLDPSFADHGRLGPIPGAAGSARSIELPDAGGIFVAGAGFRFYPVHEIGICASGTSFVKWLDERGTVDPMFHAAQVGSIQALEIARQADGKVVAVGRNVSRHGAYGRCGTSGTSTLAVFRLESDGSIDSSFGVDGVFEWSGGENGNVHQGRSVSLDPDGRIVVAGMQPVVVGDEFMYRIVVLRLLNDGSLDQDFGDGGIYVGPAVHSTEPRLVRTTAGTYRLSAGGADGCAIIGLTADGTLDATFGTAGIANVGAPGGDPVTCKSLELLESGDLFVAGSTADQGYVARLVANGAPDPTFVMDGAIADSMIMATSITPVADGKVLIAGSGPQGTSIMRLHAAGTLDTEFGDGGRTWIDLPSDHSSKPVVHDMAVAVDGSVIAAGGDSSAVQPFEVRLRGGDSAADQPFVVRLHGDEGGTSGGVMGFVEYQVYPQESDVQAVFHVRRSGGSDGNVSVNYRTQADSEATSNQDFRATSGTLDWTDGDTSEREIVVEIFQDNGPPESLESFHVVLRDAKGGAGLGTYRATASIRPDGAPGGQIQLFDIYNYGPGIARADEINPAQIWLSRNYYSTGRVCVTVTTQSGTAIAGEDFTASNATQCWDDQDHEPKVVEIPTIQDGLAEGDETFSAELSNPTGGAILGTQRVATVTILANAASEPPPSSEPPPPPPPPTDDSNGGGGPAGVVELLALLGLLLVRQRGRTVTTMRRLSL